MQKIYISYSRGASVTFQNFLMQLKYFIKNKHYERRFRRLSFSEKSFSICFVASICFSADEAEFNNSITWCKTFSSLICSIFSCIFFFISATLISISFFQIYQILSWACLIPKGAQQNP